MALERSRVTRVQWVERSSPAQPGPLPPGARPGYRALVANVETQAVEHQVYVAVQVRARPGGTERAAGGCAGQSWDPLVDRTVSVDWNGYAVVDPPRPFPLAGR
ncbi:MAG: hypothetical protein M3063_09565 [Actinomycetota bacterium]|nr:hypothetical protein [Actinomycetota bacterium]